MSRLPSGEGRDIQQPGASQHAIRIEVDQEVLGDRNRLGRFRFTDLPLGYATLRCSGKSYYHGLDDRIYDTAAPNRRPYIGFGNDDQNPSPADVDDYEAALKNAGVAYTFHRYDGAGHAFQWKENPDRYRESASEDAWDKVLAFFDTHLK